MSVATVDQLMNQIAGLPESERERLRLQLNGQAVHNAANGTAMLVPESKQRDAMRWLSDHAGEFGGEWVALDGDHLLAHDPSFESVCEIADASGVYLPLITFIEPHRDRPFVNV